MNTPHTLDRALLAGTNVLSNMVAHAFAPVMPMELLLEAKHHVISNPHPNLRSTDVLVGIYNKREPWQMRKDGKWVLFEFTRVSVTAWLSDSGIDMLEVSGMKEGAFCNPPPGDVFRRMVEAGIYKPG